ncbi:hypothetical protein R4Z10_18600 [Niallia sp. XMNu-256]|uniref:hypothetical protein n=1 Tax=Niallia sp. XMNu-256 TaxID=3082444 RepID=UPI0030D0F404
MDGQILANGLVSLKGKDLKRIYALLCRTNSGHLLTSKTKDLFSKESIDHLSKHLEEEMNKLDKNDPEIQVDLLLEMVKLLKLRVSKYTSQTEIENQCSELIQAVYELYHKQDKSFREFTESQSQLTKLQQIVQFQMGKVYRELDNSFLEFSIEDQTKFATQVHTYICSLAEHDQELIKEKLGMDPCTVESVWKAMYTQGTSVVFSVIAEVSGFAFNITTANLAANISLLLGNQALLVSHQSKLLPIVIMQMVLPYMNKAGTDVEYESFIQEWERRYKRYQRLQGRLGKIENDQIEASLQFDQHEGEIKKYKFLISEELEKIEAEKQRIKSALKLINFDTLNISSSFSQHKDEYRIVINKIRELESPRQNPSIEKNLFRKISSQIKSLTTPLDIKDEENKLDLILDRMVEAVLKSTSPFARNEREKVRLMERNMVELRAAKNREEAGKQKQEATLKRLTQKHRIVSEQIKQMEKNNEGIADLFYANEIPL